MYPLETILIVRDEGILQQLRHELARSDASVLAEFADVPAALAGLESSEGQRWLFLMHLRNQDDLRQLQKLVQAYPAQPVLAIVEEASELQSLADYAPRFGDPGSSTMIRATLFVRAMRAGAMQVVTLPLDPDDFRGALESLATRFGQPVNSTVIAVSGVQGGCGASTLALNLAHTLSETSGRKCILAELTPNMGMLASYLDLKPEYTLGDLLSTERVDPQTLKQALAPATPNLSVLCGPYRDVVTHEPAGGTASQTAELLTIIENLRRLAPVVVLDVPAWFNNRYFEVLQKADKVLLVVEQTFPSIHGLQLIQKALLPAEHQSVEVVINRYDPKVKGLSLAELKRLIKPEIWKVSLDPALTTAANEGRPVRLAAPHSKPVAEFEELAKSLVKAAPAESQSGFWTWLTGRNAAHAAAEGG